LPDHPPFTGHFVFEVDGVRIGRFTEVSGLSVEIEQKDVIEEGGQNEYIHKLPGRMKWPNLTLKRGVTVDDNLFEWFKNSSGEGFESKRARLERKLAALAMLNSEGEILRAWVFYDAFPVKWTGPKFASASSEVAVEELEIAHHGFRVGI